MAIVTEKTLKLAFKLAANESNSLVLNNPKHDLTDAQIKSAKNGIVAKGQFCKYDTVGTEVAVTAVNEAVYVTTDTEEIDITM